MPENEQGAQKCVTLYLLLISVLRGRHDSMVISILVVGSGETWSEMSRVWFMFVEGFTVAKK